MKNKPGDIQSTIMVAFSVISTLIMICMGMMVYWRFSGITQQNIVDNYGIDYTVDFVETEEVLDESLTLFKRLENIALQKAKPL